MSAAEMVTRLFSVPPGFELPWVCLHLFAGRAHNSDLEHAIALEGMDRKLHVVTVSIEVIRGQGHDLTKDATQRAVDRLLRSRRVFLVVIGPPRRTWGIGPVPWVATGAVRDRRKPWECPISAGRDRSKFVSETALAKYSIEVCRQADVLGASFVFEHPADRGPPHASVWATPECQRLLRAVEWIRVTCDFCRCRFGAAARCPTTFASNLASVAVLDLRCHHSAGHRAFVSVGRGTPATEPAERGLPALFVPRPRALWH